MSKEEVKKENPMRRIVIEKVVVNIAVGQSGEKLMKASTILRQLTGQKPSLRKAKRTIREFGIRRGENIACIVTLRGKKAYEFLDKALEAIGRRVKASSIDNFGNFSFGIHEHIQIPGTRYDPKLGIFGMDICVRLARPGYRIMYRRRKKSRVGKNHWVTKEEAIKFLEEHFNVKIV